MFLMFASLFRSSFWVEGSFSLFSSLFCVFCVSAKVKAVKFFKFGWDYITKEIFV